VLGPREFVARGLNSIGFRLMRVAPRIGPLPEPPAAANDRTLQGERDVEWAWCLAHLPASPGRVLDFGAGNGMLSLAAWFREHEVVAVDLEESQFQFRGAGIEYVRGDINDLDLGRRVFDHVINCSTVEHSGLGGRYGAREDPEGDLHAMRTLRGLLRADGTMSLAIPVGRDAVHRPWHRVYGRERLPRLLEGFEVRAESYWAKVEPSIWEPVGKERALDESSSANYYALGLYLLAPT
jgi:SAM-dependent methyltransferase